MEGNTPEEEATTYIPIRGTRDAVAVKNSELPTDPEDILDVLRAETAPLSCWIRFAILYLKMGKEQQCKQILDAGSDPVIDNIPEYTNEESKRDRIAILNMLAAYETLKATRVTDKREKDALYTAARQNFDRADKIDVLDELTWVTKGLQMLMREEIPRAMDTLNNVLSHNPKSIAGVMCKARGLYMSNKTEEALALYKESLTICPKGPASIRFEMGLCYLRLNKPNAAKKAFLRTLQLQPDNIGALCGSAMCEANQAALTKDITKIVDHVRKSMAYIKSAQKIDPEYPTVLIFMCDFYFHNDNLNKSRECAQKALSRTQVDKMKAEAHFRLGRVSHVRGDFAEAYQNYSQAVKFWAEHAPSQFGLGQMHLQRNETEKAVKCFESVLGQYPDNFESLKILASLNRSNILQAYTYLKKVTELQPNDVEAWIEMAQLQENKPAEALDFYRKARDALVNKKEEVPYQLENNIGVLEQMLGNQEAAEEAYHKVVGDDQDKWFETSKITTTYNRARLHESRCEFAEAQRLYNGILKDFPQYTDCYLRLGCIAKLTGNISEASDWFKKALENDEKSIDAHILDANLQLDNNKEKFSVAQKIFEKVSATEKFDPYVHLSLGNIFHKSRYDREDKSERNLQHAMAKYMKVMNSNPTNIYAANGVGIVMAEQGRLSEAKDIFNEILPYADRPDMRINLAHINMAQGRYGDAIVLYQNCLKKYHNNKDPTLLLYLAKAYHEDKRHQECRQTLLKAIHLSPHDKALWFNLAYSYEQNAVSKLQNQSKRRSLEEVNAAFNMLGEAIKINTWLQNTKPEPSGTNYLARQKDP